MFCVALLLLLCSMCGPALGAYDAEWGPRGRLVRGSAPWDAVPSFSASPSALPCRVELQGGRAVMVASVPTPLDGALIALLVNGRLRRVSSSTSASPGPGVSLPSDVVPGVSNVSLVLLDSQDRARASCHRAFIGALQCNGDQCSLVLQWAVYLASLMFPLNKGPVHDCCSL